MREWEGGWCAVQSSTKNFDTHNSMEKLKNEFGCWFVFSCFYSGELLGYRFDSWEELDATLNEWCADQNRTRKQVVEKWQAMWNEESINTAPSARDAAFERSLVEFLKIEDI